MALDPGEGFEIRATVAHVKGHCVAGHHAGETLALNCFDSGGLCGFFYHDIFPALETFQFGGKLPWWKGDTVELQCPDPVNLVTIKLERSPRT